MVALARDNPKSSASRHGSREGSIVQTSAFASVPLAGSVPLNAWVPGVVRDVGPVPGVGRRRSALVGLARRSCSVIVGRSRSSSVSVGRAR